LNYNRVFWAGYKLHVRSMLTGGVLGLGVGGAVGLAMLPFAGPAALIATAGTGMVMGAEGLSNIGTISGTRAATLAEKHARALDPANEGNWEKIYNDKLMLNGRGHHYDFPTDQSDDRVYYWKSGIAGTLIGATAGALLGLAGIAFLGTAAIPAAIGSALFFGIFGATYG